jgi:hypothetical protein
MTCHNTPAGPTARFADLTRATRKLSEAQMTEVVGGGDDGPGNPGDNNG